MLKMLHMILLLFCAFRWTTMTAKLPYILFHGGYTSRLSVGCASEHLTSLSKQLQNFL